MRGNTHVRCGERVGETDREQSRNRAPARLSIIGQGGESQIATLVERASRYVMLVRIPYDRTAERVAALLARKMETRPQFLRNSITWDQGKEMAAHAKFTVKTRNRRLFLRSALTLAAGQQREHERLAAPVLPERNRPLRVHAGRTRCRRRRTQRPST